MQTLIALASFVVAFAVSALCMPWVIKLCLERGWVIHPGGRRTHAGVMPTIGGISIYIGFVVTILVMWGIGFLVPELKRNERDELRLWLMLTGATLTFAVMWLDDVVELHWMPKFATNVVAGLIAVAEAMMSAIMVCCINLLRQFKSNLD
jgi:UDP-GlcNAc:undecaprenyl-phosphate GlcNAc-1-phosphate transferase